MSVNVKEVEYKGLLKENGEEWQPENTVEVEKKSLRQVVEKICRNEDCRYPLLSVRVLIHVITSLDASGRVHLSARHLSKSMDVNYDTVNKCLKYLRDTEILRFDKDR